MAVALASKQNIEGPNAEYPYGSIRDRVGLVPGTPVDREVYSDMHQFFEKLMALAEIVHNDVPDNEYDGYQLFQAFGRLANGGSLSNLYAIDQTGVSNPTLQGLNNDLLPFSSTTATRTGVGEYEITFSPSLTVGDTFPNAVMLIPSSGQATSSVNETVDCRMNNGKILISTAVSGTPTDGILDNYVFELRLIGPAFY